MSALKPFTCRRGRSSKRRAIIAMLLLVISTINWPFTAPTLRAQTGAGGAPVGAGLVITAEDLRFVFHQIEVSQEHVVTRSASDPCGTLLGPGPNQVNLFGQVSFQLPLGLRLVDGSCNNLVPIPDQHLFGAADQLFPRVTTPVFRAGESATSYQQLTGDVIDSRPRLITNLIVDQTAKNPAAAAAALNPCGSGGFVCQGQQDTDAVTGSFFIPNITPDFGLSAPFNLMFTFFGQFFDHGLDLVNKGGNGMVVMPLKADDPLFVPGADTNFMAINRATVNAQHNSVNQTTPWVDQNQTYTSHPAHQVFLRDYTCGNTLNPTCTQALPPLNSGKVLDGGFCATRTNGVAGEQMCNIANWSEVKAQASRKLGIQLRDQDVFDTPLVLTDPYGHFVPGPLGGFPQLVLPPTTPGGTPRLVEGNPTLNGNLGVDNQCAIGAGATCVAALRTGHQFLNDIAHNAAPNPGLTADPDAIVSVINPTTHAIVPTQPANTYDNELLDRHFITGDGRGNENIALTTMHTIFHAEHNRLRNQIDSLINTAGFLTAQERTAWTTVHPGSRWDYGERLFQAARLFTEMQYQHLVFEEFARKIQPLINPFLGGITSINGSISAEFAHTVYRLGHSMLPEIIARINLDAAGAEVQADVRLRDAFLNPLEFNSGGQSAMAAVGSLARGMSREVANELDEFITDSVRNTLVGLPQDLGAINLARGRSEGVPPLNKARAEFYTQTRNSALAPYANWFEFGLNLRHRESLANFIAAYGTHASITGVLDCTAPTTPTNPNTTCGLKGRRTAAQTLVNANASFLFDPAATSGLDEVDYWVGGLAERQAAFGGLLGTTFNFVFEKQLENLQNGDRFYYLQRLDGVPFRDQLESNSFAELIRRNSNLGGTMDVIFNTADFNFNAAALTGTAPIDLSLQDPSCVGCQILTTPDGTKIFFDPLHQGKNIVFNGGPGNDRFMGDIGDDTLFGNAGADRLEGNDGNDTIIGGDGDDVLFGGNGDDVLKGGPGNDALSAGPGFAGDIILAGDGNDFLLGGDDGVEHFGGNGDDVFVDGAERAEGMFGGLGDDWIYAGDGHDGGMFGDEGNVFDLLAGVGKVGGDDVLDGGPGQDNAFGEGGDDIMLMSEGSNKFFGDFGFDWITLRGWNAPEFIELGLLGIPNAPVNFNDVRSKYRFVDGASGWDRDDHIAGSDNILCDPAAGAIAECLVIGMELTAGTAPTTQTARNNAGQAIVIAGVTQVNIRGGSGAAKIAGLTQLMGPAGFNQSLTAAAIPGIKGVGFMGGDILLGGRGSDLLEGKQGDDLIDGDRWLNVQLRAVYNARCDQAGVDLRPGCIGAVRLVNDAQDLVADVFSDPQRLDPGNISIIRTIVTPSTPPPDCGAAVRLNCDTAVFNFPLADYDITPLANGSVRVTHVPNGVSFSEGTDTLLGIEQLKFSDVTVATPGGAGLNGAVPNVLGLTTADATAAIVAAGLTVGTISEVPNPAVAVGVVFGQDPGAGFLVLAGGRVSLNVSSGAPSASVPNVVGSTETVATASITAAGLVVGNITRLNSNTVALGVVINQTPAFGGPEVEGGSQVHLTISLGPAFVTVPTVPAGSNTATATSLIQSAGLVVGTITQQDSLTVPTGNVISQSPAGGSQALAGSPVSLFVSIGSTLDTGLVASFDFNETSGSAVIDSAVNKTGVTGDVANNGTMGGGVTRVAGRTGAGGALQFNGTTGMVTVPDNAALRPTKLTLSAWVKSDRPVTESSWRSVILKERAGDLVYGLYGNAAADGGPGGYIRRAPVATTVNQHANSTTRLPQGVWVHLVTTYDGAVLRTYVNGSEVRSINAAGALITNTGSLRIGGNSVWGEFFAGAIDDVKIYNRALSAVEVAALTNTLVP